jgi:hypothetical protein
MPRYTTTRSEEIQLEADDAPDPIQPPFARLVSSMWVPTSSVAEHRPPSSEDRNFDLAYSHKGVFIWTWELPD